MAAFTLMFTPTCAAYGRSGYNKDGDDDNDQNRGRSGYNKDGDEENDQNRGRSGYNKDDDEDSK